MRTTRFGTGTRFTKVRPDFVEAIRIFPVHDESISYGQSINYRDFNLKHLLVLYFAVCSTCALVLAIALALALTLSLILITTQ